MSEIISGKQLVAERIVTDVEVEDLALGFMGRKSALGRIAGALVAAGGAVCPGDPERKGLQRVGTARGRDRNPAGRAVAGSSGAVAVATETSQQPAGQSRSQGSGSAAVASSQTATKAVEATAPEGMRLWKVLVHAAVFVVAAFVGVGLYLRSHSP